MKQSILLFLSLCLAQASWSAAEPLPDVIQRWLDANNTANEVVRNGIIDSVVSEDFESGGLDGNVTGDRAGFKKYLSGAHKAFAQYQLLVRDHAKEKDKVWLRVVATGIHSGEILGKPPTGNTISVGTVVILQILGGQVVREWHITDTAALTAQLNTERGTE